MLTEQEQQEIDEVLRHAERSQAAVPDALKIVQKHRRWVSNEAIADVAVALGLSPSEVDAVATCYNQIFRQPVGRHVIQLCDSVSCWTVGYNDLREYLEKTLGVGMGQTTPDGRFTMVPCACLGACELAPAMMVDEDLHGNLTHEIIDAILVRYP